MYAKQGLLVGTAVITEGVRQEVSGQFRVKVLTLIRQFQIRISTGIMPS